MTSTASRPIPLIARSVAVLAVGLNLAVIAVLVSLGSASWDRSAGNLLFVFIFAALPASLGVMGAVIQWRQPRNSIGWIFSVSSIFASLGVMAGGYVQAHPNGLDSALGSIALWLGAWAMLPAIGLLVAVLPLVFPTGRLLSPRWRVVLAIDAVGMILSLLGMAFAPGPMDGAPVPVDNPFGIAALAPLAGAAGVLNAVVVPFAFSAGVVALVIRFRRSQGDERQQFKWFFSVALVTAACFLVSFINIPPISDVGWALGIVSMILLPVAVGIAILRYRLYDIDLIINRTIVYAAVTAVLVVGFWLADIGLQREIESVSGQRSEAVTGALGVAVGLLFVPVRRRVRPLVDRILPARSQLTLLFTDIVGSTEAIVEMGDERWRGVLTQYLAAVRAEIARFGGHEVNTAGDAFFATFHRPAAAVEAAGAIRDAVLQLGLETRTGLHLDEVEMRGEQVSGLAVHTAARVMAAAMPGEILVSDAVREAIAGDAVQLTDRGRHILKGVPGEWQLFAAEVRAAV